MQGQAHEKFPTSNQLEMTNYVKAFLLICTLSFSLTFLQQSLRPLTTNIPIRPSQLSLHFSSFHWRVKDCYPALGGQLIDHMDTEQQDQEHKVQQNLEG